MKEARIGQIYSAQDAVDSQRLANMTPQPIQTADQIVTARNNLTTQEAQHWRSEIDDSKSRMKALTDSIAAGAAPSDFADQMNFQQNRLERAMAGQDKFQNDPYWKSIDTGKIIAGQKTLNARQTELKAQGVADVAARKSREQYGQNAMDTLTQAEFARQEAALKAETAQSNRQAAGTSAEQIAERRAAAKAEQDQKIDEILFPTEVKIATVDALKQQRPEWREAESGIQNGIKILSGKRLHGSEDRNAYATLQDSFNAFGTLPPELQQSVAGDILSELASSGLSIPKEAYADSRFSGFMDSLVDKLIPGTTGIRSNTAEGQALVNDVLEHLKSARASNRQ